MRHISVLAQTIKNKWGKGRTAKIKSHGNSHKKHGLNDTLHYEDCNSHLFASNSIGTQGIFHLKMCRTHLEIIQESVNNKANIDN